MIVAVARSASVGIGVIACARTAMGVSVAEGVDWQADALTASMISQSVEGRDNNSMITALSIHHL